jgi:hypothetical protein
VAGVAALIIADFFCQSIYIALESGLGVGTGNGGFRHYKALPIVFAYIERPHLGVDSGASHTKSMIDRIILMFSVRFTT